MSAVTEHGLAGFNELPATEARKRLTGCCAAPSWVAMVADGRPYPSPAALADAADRAMSQLDWPAIGTALAAHPRIGERSTGTGREANWSRSEQAGALDSEDAVRQELAAGNAAYERRFGHVFLICATGLSAAQMLAALRSRLANDDLTERGVVRVELARIARLRLGKLLAELADRAAQGARP